MFRYSVSGAACALTAVLASAPVLAGVMSATIALNTTNYSGPCPTSITATAIVSGSAGTTFQYAFYRAGKPVLPTMPGVIGASGSFTAHDTISLSNSVYDFDEIWVSAIAGQSDLYSSRALYNVTCVAPGGNGHIPISEKSLAHGPSPVHAGPYRITLQPAKETVFSKENLGCGGLSTFSQACLDLGHILGFGANSGVPLGFRYWTDKRLAGDLYVNDLYRAAFQFDLPDLQHHAVTNATLTLTLVSTLVYEGGQWDQPSPVNCASDFGPTHSDWQGMGGASTQWLDADFGETFTPSGGKLTANVAHDVLVWSAYGGNFGWVVKGPDENLGAFTELECISFYSAMLHLEYY